jgi:ATP-dependent helicase/nuclease subunit A
MSVLVRTNAQLEDVGAHLNSKGLPVHLHSSGLFWERREVQDAVALLKFFLNPFDDLNLVKLLRAPFISITDRQLAEALRSRDRSAWESVRDGMKSGEYGSAGQKLFEFLSLAPKLGVVVAFQRGLEALGFFDLHLRYDPTGRAEGNLWKLVHLLKTFERERGANLIRFVNDAERPERMDRTVDAPGSVEPNKINIMTVHAAKGLQFDYVFLPFLGKDPRDEKFRRFSVDEAAKKWSVRAPTSEEETSSSASLFEKKVIADFRARQLEEDLRVFYVAYTRAKKQLYFSWSRPAGTSSWARYLTAFDTEAGIHQGEGFTFSVHHVDKPVAAIAAPNFTAYKEIPPLFKEKRDQPWANEYHEEHAVTTVLADDIPFKKNYKNSFLRKTEGILFHKILEIIKYPTQKDIGALVGEWFPGDEERVGAALNYALALQDPPLVELIKNGHVEWAFRTKKSAPFKELEGQIDLWGQACGKLWLVDYKSGEKVLKEKSFRQLRVYASAVKDYLGWKDEIHLAVVYPFLQEAFIETVTEEDLIF